MVSKIYVALVALFILLTPSARADRLFVLHGGESTASVFDPRTLEPVGSAPAPAGVFRVFGLPADPDSARLAKYYLVGARSIVVADAQYQEIRRVDLPAPAVRSPHGAALSGDGSRLFVATRFGVVAIRTSDDTIVARLIPGFPIGGVALLPDAGRALVFADGAPAARSIHVAQDRLGDEISYLAAPLAGASSSPAGTRSLGVADSGVYDLAALRSVRFSGAVQPLLSGAGSSDAAARLAVLGSGSKSPAPAASDTRIAVTDSGRFFLAREGRLLRGSPTDSRLAAVVQHPGDGSPIDPRTTLWSASADGSQLFVAESNGDRLFAFNPDDLGAARSVSLSAAPTGVELVAPRVRQAGLLELITLNNSEAAGGTTFRIRVRATDGAGSPQRDVPVFVTNISPAMPSLSCLSGLTNAEGEAALECTLGAVASQTTVQLTISDAVGRTAPIFNLAAVPPTAAEGLAKVDGDGQRVPSDSPFTFTVQLSRNRLPVEGSVLRITTDPVDPEIFTCQLQATTDENGMAEIPCTSKELAGSEQVSVTVTEFATGDAVTFVAVIDPQAEEQTRIIKVSGDGQTVVQGSFFTVTAQVTDLAGFSPIVNVFVQNLSQSVPPAITCPTNAAIDEDGFVTVRCQAGSIQGSTASGEIQIAHFGTTMADPFKINIVRSGGGFGGTVDTLELLSQEDFPVVPGVAAVNAIRVKALRNDGQAAPNVNIYFSSPGDVVFDPPIAQTDASGIATTTVTAGCNDAGDPVVFVGLEPGSELLDLRADIQPGSFSQLEKTQGDNQSGAPGQQLNAAALVVVAQDQCGNIIPMQEVEWRVVPEYRGSLRNVINITDDRGRASALATLGQFGGPFQVEVGVGEVKTRFDLAVNLPTEELVLRSGDNQNALSGQALAQPLVVQALGITGFGVGGVPVQWSATGPAQIVGSAAETDSTGVAYARVRLGAAANPQQGTRPSAQVTATAMGKSVTFFINGSPKPVAPVEAFVNGASFLSGWTPGSAGSIFGQLLAPQLTVADQTPFPTNLGGVSVTINGTPAPLIFVAPGQINLQVPVQTQVGPATVVVDNNGQSTTVQNVPVNAIQPGIFANSGYAAALREDFSVITTANPAVPGEVVQLYFTGGGPTAPAVQTNQPGPSSPLAFTTNGIVVGVDGEGQNVLASVYAPGLITAYQVNFVLGAGVESGDRDLSIVINGVASQTVKLPVQ